MNDTALSADYIVVGSGPGGAALSRELARAGKQVILFERGIDHRGKFYYGTYLGPLIYCDRASLLFTRERLNIVSPLMVGGATSMYCGCAAYPPDWIRDKYNIDLSAEVDETVSELNIAPLPEALRGQASTHIAGAAGRLGYEWQPVLKFMNPGRAAKFKCGANCMLGCRCGAKWNAAEYVDDAVSHGAVLRTKALVEQVLFEGNRCVGVVGTLGGQPFRARAKAVILSAGGIGTPRILQKSGFPDAGIGMTMDTTIMVYGFRNQPGIGKEPPMTWYWEDFDDGYMLSTLMDPWLMFPLIMTLKGLRYPLLWPKWGNMLGIMIKLKDEVSGGVFANGTISKPSSEKEMRRTAKAVDLCTKILIAAGANPENIVTTPQRGTHPSGTVRIGTMLDENLRTTKEGLYVCDASVFPEALCRPTVLTIIGFAKRLAKHLLNNT